MLVSDIGPIYISSEKESACWQYLDHQIRVLALNSGLQVTLQKKKIHNVSIEHPNPVGRSW